jgi:hypothetical protein
VRTVITITGLPLRAAPARTTDDQKRDADGKFGSGGGGGSSSGGEKKSDGGEHAERVKHHSSEQAWHEARAAAIRKKRGDAERRGDIGSPGKVLEKLGRHDLAASYHQKAAELYKEGKVKEAQTEGRVAHHHAKNVGRWKE